MFAYLSSQQCAEWKTWRQVNLQSIQQQILIVNFFYSLTFLINFNLCIDIFLCWFKLFVKFHNIFFDVIAVNVRESLQVFCCVFHFIFCKFVKIQNFQVWTSVEDESKPEVVSVAVKVNFSDVCVDWNVHEEWINCECWLVSEDVDCDFFDCWRNNSPCLKHCLEILAVNNHMFITHNQITLFPIFFTWVTHEEFLHD